MDVGRSPLESVFPSRAARAPLRALAGVKCRGAIRRLRSASLGDPGPSLGCARSSKPRTGRPSARTPSASGDHLGPAPIRTGEGVRPAPRPAGVYGSSGLSWNSHGCSGRLAPLPFPFASARTSSLSWMDSVLPHEPHDLETESAKIKGLRLHLTHVEAARVLRTFPARRLTWPEDRSRDFSELLGHTDHQRLGILFSPAFDVRFRAADALDPDLHQLSLAARCAASRRRRSVLR